MKARFRPGRRLALALVPSLLLTACSFTVDAFRVLEANRRFTAGDYHGAALLYLPIASERPEAAYDLGMVYGSLGELESARQAWAEARASTSPEIRGRAWFAEALADFGRADYPRAAEEARAALEASPGLGEARVLYELALQAMEEKEASPRAKAEAEAEPGVGESAVRLSRPYDAGGFLPGGRAAEEEPADDY